MKRAAAFIYIIFKVDCELGVVIGSDWDKTGQVDKGHLWAKDQPVYDPCVNGSSNFNTHRV